MATYKNDLELDLQDQNVRLLDLSDPEEINEKNNAVSKKASPMVPQFKNFSRRLKQHKAINKIHELDWDELQALGQKNDLDALRELGVRYHYGYGVLANKKRSREYFEQATERGDEFSKGFCFEQGIHRPENNQSAFACYERAANQHLAIAQHHLGKLYLTRESVPKAKSWFKKAAAQNLAMAKYELAKIYLYKHAVMQNNAHVKSKHWFSRLNLKRQKIPELFNKAKNLLTEAANQGLAEAQSDLGVLYFKGIGVDKNSAVAREWLQKAADQANVIAQLNLASMHRDQGDYDQARSWFQKAAQQGDPTAQCNLGEMCVMGVGGVQDLIQARTLFQSAAKEGNIIADRNLAFMCLDGQGGDKSPVEAKQGFYRAAMKGDAIAQRALGYLYLNNSDSEDDCSQARAWFQRAAIQHDLMALKELARMCQNGEGGPQSYKEAQFWLNQAVKLGDAEAEETLTGLTKMLEEFSMFRDNPYRPRPSF